MFYQNSFPVYALPTGLRDVVFEVHSNVQAPYEIIFASVLGALSLVSQDQVMVRRPNGVMSPCSMNIITIADSGERKTGCDNLIMQPIRDFDVAAEKIYEEATTQYKADHQVWSIQANALRAALRTLALQEAANDAQ